MWYDGQRKALGGASAPTERRQRRWHIVLAGTQLVVNGGGVELSAA